MQLTEDGKKFIKDFEGCRLTRYLDQVGNETIGYGHTGTNLPMTITKSQADEYFNKDIQEAESKVNKYSQYSFTQNQFTALVSFAYNIGNIDQLTANGTRTLSEIASNIKLYIYAGGQENEALKNRRQQEYELFLDNKSNIISEIKIYNYSKDKNTYISKNFQVKEFIANGTPLRTMYEKGKYTSLLISSKLVNYLQRIRDHFNKPVVITSGYRPEEYNKSVNGATSSYHIKGRATDIHIDGISVDKLADYCKSIGIKGVGEYKNFVHIDTRDSVYYWKGE